MPGNGVPFAKGQDPRRGRGIGRPTGSLNQSTIDVREAARELVNNIAYRRKLASKLRAGTCAPAVETLLWQYAYGKPKQLIEVTGENGGPIQTQHLSELSDADLHARAAAVADALEKASE